MDVEEVHKRAKGGALVLLGRRAFALTLTLLTTTIIARLVSPRDFGLAAISGLVLTLADMFKDFGLTSALMRKGEVSQQEISFLFWFNAATTTALMLIIAALAPVVAVFFHEPVVLWIILVSLGGFALSGFTTQHYAMLNRDLRFNHIAAIDMTMVGIQTVATLILAFAWRNVWALVIGSLLGSLLSSVLTVVLSRWRPGRPAMIPGVKDLLKFGANTSVFSLAVFVSNNAAPFLIGHALGAASLGQFNRAQALFQMPGKNLIEPITQAGLPVMARLRAHPLHYRVAYLKLVERLCLIVMPGSVLLTCIAVPMVHVLLGDQWRQAGYVLAALAPALAGLGFAHAVSDLFITQNRSSELRTIGIVEMVTRCGAVFIGVKFGLVSAAAAYSASTLLSVPLRIFMAGREGPVDVRAQLGACLPALPIAGGVVVGCALPLLLAVGVEMSSLVLTVSIGLAGGLGAVAAALVFRGSRVAVTEQVADLLAWRKPALVPPVQTL